CQMLTKLEAVTLPDISAEERKRFYDKCVTLLDQGDVPRPEEYELKPDVSAAPHFPSDIEDPGDLLATFEPQIVRDDVRRYIKKVFDQCKQNEVTFSVNVNRESPIILKVEPDKAEAARLALRSDNSKFITVQEAERIEPVYILATGKSRDNNTS